MAELNDLGLVFFPAFDFAISKTHPEREERLLYTRDQIYEEGILDFGNIKLFNPLVATDADITRVHFPVPDVTARVSDSHKVSVGATIKAFEVVLAKEVDKAFALVRPPGHHAMKVVHGDRGFCVVNIEAIALEHIRAKYGDLKVAIIDTDCHHGDGTQDIYWNDPQTLFISIHQDGRTLYPGTGFLDDLGGPSAYGYNLNIPLPPRTGDEGLLYIIEETVLPILADFKPDLIINSAGQDNHYSDPLTNMNVSAQGYAKLNELLSPDIAVLEGGYSIESALPYVNLGIILAMAGLDYSEVREPDYNAAQLKQDRELTEYIKRIAEEVNYRWQNKEALAQEKFASQRQVQEEKQIYYDTDNILEQQTRSYELCPTCPGYETFKSSSDRAYRILGISLPSQACPSCQTKAYELYEKSKTGPGTFTHVYLQDRVSDLYLSK